MPFFALKKYITHADSAAVNRAWFICVVISGIAGAGYFLWLLNTYRELVGLQQHFRQLQHQYQQQITVTGQLNEPEQRARLNSLLLRAVRKEQLSVVTELLAAEVQQSGLQLQQMQWLPEQEKPLFKVQPLAISLRGNYHQLGILLHGLSRQPVLLGWHDLSISAVRDKELALQLTISIYHSAVVSPDEYAEPEDQIPEPESYVAHALRDPFAAVVIKPGNIPSCNRDDESQFAAVEPGEFMPEQLIFRGVLQDSQQTLAVVEDLQQRLHLIGITMTKDLFRGEVLSVKHDALEIRDWASDADGCMNPRITRFTLAGALL